MIVVPLLRVNQDKIINFQEEYGVPFPAGEHAACGKAGGDGVEKNEEEVDENCMYAHQEIWLTAFLAQQLKVRSQPLMIKPKNDSTARHHSDRRCAF